MHLDNTLPTRESAYAVNSIELAPGIEHGVTDDDLAAVLPYCEELVGLDLRGLPDLSERTLLVLAHNHYVNMLYLDLSGCTQDLNAGLCEVVGQNLDIQGLRLNGTAGITDATVTFAVRSLANLVELQLADQPLVTAASMRDVWSLAKPLQKLILRGCGHISDKGFPSPFGEPPRDAIQHVASIPPDSKRVYAGLEKLAVLELGSQASTSNSRVTSWLDDSMSPLVLPAGHELKHLRELDLCYCNLITDTAIAGIVTHARFIRKLSLAGCVELTDASLRDLMQLRSTLVSVNLAHVEKITDEGFRDLVRACRLLKYVDVGCELRSFVLALGLLIEDYRSLQKADRSCCARTC